MILLFSYVPRLDDTVHVPAVSIQKNTPLALDVLQPPALTLAARNAATLALGDEELCTAGSTTSTESETVSLWENYRRGEGEGEGKTEREGGREV